MTNISLALKFLRRRRILTRFLGVEVGEYLTEAEKITEDMHRFVPRSEMGTMLSPLRGPVLYACVRALKPSIMVETGVAQGSSSRFILEAMEKNGNGQLHSVDLPNVDPRAVIPKDKQTGWLVQEQLRHRWHLVLGDTKKELPVILDGLRMIDMFLHDSEHTYEIMRFEYELASRHLKPNGLLLSDDVTDNKAFEEFSAGKDSLRFGGLGAIRF